MEYGYKKKANISFEEAVARVRAKLQEEEFGILTEIDVKSTLKEKLGVDYDNYIVLGTCNPLFAYKALEAEKDIGLLLPCNVIVYKDADDVFISAIVPTVAMGMVQNESLAEIAEVVEGKLKKVIDVVVGNG
jgi:uncharacterized protein (DUF302 family)